MDLFWFAVCLWSCYGPSVSQHFRREVSHPGDVMIGGLFPIHKNVSKETCDGRIYCSDVDVTMLIRAQAMIYAIEKINESPDLLPNVSIGYKIYDTCGNVSMATRGTLKLLEQSHGNMCPLLEETPGTGAEGVKVVIGERDSETSTVVARLLALPKVAQISYASTSELLSSKTKFPSFLRTVPSDKHQTKAIAQFVKEQKWDIVGVIGSDDEYGRYGSETLIDLFNQNEACIAFKEILPAEFIQNKTELEKIITKIEKTPTEAIVIFTKTKNVKVILEKAIERRVNRTWLASDSWSTSTEISGLDKIAQIGRVFGFTSKRNKIPDFKKNVRHLVSHKSAGDNSSFLLNYPTCSQDHGDSPSSCEASESGQKCLQSHCLRKFIDHDESYSVYLAVNVIAHALNSLLKCNTNGCKGNTSFSAWELLEEIKKVNTTVDGNTHIWFDGNGDPSIGQEILEWKIERSKVNISCIGEYDTSGTIKLNTNHNMDNSSTETNCAKSCQPGYELQRVNNSCCKTCHLCEVKFFSKGNGEKCKSCSDHQYASPKRDSCLDKKISFLKWGTGWSINLMVLDCLGAVFTVLVAVLFFVQRRTPIVKAAGGYLCFLALLSLLACFASVAVGLSEPRDVTCKIEMPLFLLAFTLCVACILANLLQVFVGFNFSVTMTSALKKLNRPALVTFVCFGVQAVLCSLWVIFWPPNKIAHHDRETRIIIACCKGSDLLCVAVFLYVCLLAVVCFIFAYNGRRLPDLYKNARYVAVSMLIYLVVCVLFLPFYFSSVSRYGQGIKACALLLITYSVLICHFAPKCYIMLFKKELNNESALAEYIRNHYSQKSIAVLSS